MKGRRVGGVVLKGQEIAAEEVVLSAGALGSPQVLLKNGIGSEQSLRDAGVACVHHLPGVGENLQDHLQLRPKFRVKAQTLNSEVGGLVRHAVRGQWLRLLPSRKAWQGAWQFLRHGGGPVSMAASQAEI